MWLMDMMSLAVIIEGGRGRVGVMVVMVMKLIVHEDHGG